MQSRLESLDSDLLGLIITHPYYADFKRLRALNSALRNNTVTATLYSSKFIFR